MIYLFFLTSSRLLWIGGTYASECLVLFECHIQIDAWKQFLTDFTNMRGKDLGFDGHSNLVRKRLCLGTVAGFYCGRMRVTITSPSRIPRRMMCCGYPFAFIIVRNRSVSSRINWGVEQIRRIRIISVLNFPGRDFFSYPTSGVLISLFNLTRNTLLKTSVLTIFSLLLFSLNVCLTSNQIWNFFLGKFLNVEIRETSLMEVDVKPSLSIGLPDIESIPISSSFESSSDTSNSSRSCPTASVSNSKSLVLLSWSFWELREASSVPSFSMVFTVQIPVRALQSYSTPW